MTIIEEILKSKNKPKERLTNLVEAVKKREDIS
jgi:hypothetical protein